MQLHKAGSDAYDYRWVVEGREHNADQFALVYVATRNDATSAVSSVCGSTQASASQVENGWVKKQVRINTRMCYSCVKYNGVAEDLEGYAWLLSKFLSSQVLPKTLDPKAELFGAVGTFDADPNKIVDLYLGLKEETQVRDDGLEGITSRFCFERTQLVGFHIQRSLAKARKPRYGQLVRFLMDNCRVMPEEIYVHLWPNEGILYTALAGTSLAGFSISCPSLQRGICILDDVFSERDWDERSYFFIKRLSQIGFSIQQFPKLLKASLRQLDLALSAASSSDLMHVCDRVETIGPALVCDPSLYTRVLVYLKDSMPMSERERNGVARILATCILPALSRVKPNPMLSTSVWEVLSHFSFARRGKIYHTVMEMSQRWRDPLNQSSERAASATHLGYCAGCPGRMQNIWAGN